MGRPPGSGPGECLAEEVFVKGKGGGGVYYFCCCYCGWGWGWGLGYHSCSGRLFSVPPETTRSQNVSIYLINMTTVCDAIFKTWYWFRFSQCFVARAAILAGLLVVEVIFVIITQASLVKWCVFFLSFSRWRKWKADEEFWNNVTHIIESLFMGSVYF